MASFGDILTAAQNVVKAINNVATTYLNVQGQTNVAAIAASSLVSPNPGRLATVSVTTAGSAAGLIYDSNMASNTTRPIWTIPMTVDVTVVNIPVQYGILVVPGTGQVLTVTYS